MTARRPAALTTIAPCPRPGCKGKPRIQDAGLDSNVQVVCPCGWVGPRRASERAAILAWNPRSDAEAERRGAMASLAYLDNQDGDPFAFAADALRLAIECDEVLPAKKARKR